MYVLTLALCENCAGQESGLIVRVMNTATNTHYDKIFTAALRQEDVHNKLFRFPARRCGYSALNQHLLHRVAPMLPVQTISAPPTRVRVMSHASSAA